MSAQELKGLQVRKTKLMDELRQKKAELYDVQQACATISQKISAIDRQIADFQLVPTVSEHAMLRYVERVMKVDLEEIRKNLLTERVSATIDFVNSGRVPHEGGFSLIVKNKTIVTIED